MANFNRLRVWINGVERTDHLDVLGNTTGTTIKDLTFLDLFTFGPGLLLFPGFDVRLERPGYGRWDWLTEGASVLVRGEEYEGQPIADMEHVWKGQIDCFRPTPEGLEVPLEGRLFALGAEVVPPKIGRLSRTTTEAFLLDLINGATGQRFFDLVNDLTGNWGTYYSARGDYSTPLDMAVDAVDQSGRSDGKRLTIGYVQGQDGPRIMEYEKNNKAWTVDTKNSECDLVEDKNSRVMAVFASWITPRGGASRGAKYADATDSSLGLGKIHPIAHVPEWGRRLYDTDGNDLGPNPLFDNKVASQEVYLDYGDGISTADVTESCKAYLAFHKEAPVQGTITLHGEEWLGVRARDKFTVTNWLGRSVVVFVSEAHIDWVTYTVTLTVSTRKGTFVSTADAITQRRTEKASRRETNGRTPSTKGQGIVWDADSPAGIIKPTAVTTAGKVLRTPMPEFGDVVRSTFATSPNAEFAVWLFRKQVTVAQVEAITGGSPLTIAGNPSKGKEQALHDLGMVRMWGSKESPGGYGVGTKAAANETAVPLIGTLREDESWPFRLDEAAPGECLWVVVWPSVNTTFSGRLWPGVATD